ncbi:hypothetical protein LO762_26765 [Actinocorallia sp. API 0066]|uniref:hypothetical protein n=1 Tax=Actinocorallia sp. API 0066 TaxID=2896846 RepID=UPI001E36DFDE|nr:hypothetical protein [Actinocorallia sp. API 0066]MCD0452756.1 hypothetical protein [Actinocorallia sp. API 0066]
MRRGVLAVVLLAVTAAQGCSVVDGVLGNRAEVCEETQEAIDGFAAQLKTLPPNDNAAWAQAATDFATRLDGLAKKSDDAKLRDTLTGLATSWREAGPGLTDTGDVAKLTELVRDQPAKLGAACG